MVSLAGCIEAYLYEWLGTYHRNVRSFIVPSGFLASRLREAGFDRTKIKHIPHFIHTSEYTPRYDLDGYFLYAGAITSMKGVQTLVQAMKQVRSARLVIAGDGDYRTAVEKYVSENGLTETIKFLGWVDLEQVRLLMERAMFVVVPSQWYENSPMTIYEAFALGKPVIGSRTGGIPELIEDNENGLLFERGNVDDLAEKVQYLLDRPTLVVEMGKQARAKAEREYNPDLHYQRIADIYANCRPGHS
jgi:glycosyltransferase involved in cell wall biosynthesis